MGIWRTQECEERGNRDGGASRHTRLATTAAKFAFERQLAALLSYPAIVNCFKFQEIVGNPSVKRVDLSRLNSVLQPIPICGSVADRCRAGEFILIRIDHGAAPFYLPVSRSAPFQ